MVKENFHVKAGRKAQFILNPVISILIFILIFIIGQLFAIPFRFLLHLIFNNPVGLMANTINGVFSGLLFPFGILIIIFFAFTKKIEKRPIRTLGFHVENATIKYLKGFLIGITMMATYFLIALLVGTLDLSELKFQFTDLKIWISILIVLPGWIVQGASEEIMTRGWLYQSASSKYGGQWGLIIAPTIFGILHIMNSNASFFSMINLVLFGLFAVLYVLNDGGLWGICALHSAWNWTQGNILGINISGNAAIGGSLIIPGASYGQDFITGADFGAEGSAIITVILCCSIIYLFIKINKNRINNSLSF